jgi:cell division protein FtsW (lipid II flippase)
MSTTREAARKFIAQSKERQAWEGRGERRGELILLIAATAAIALGLTLVYGAKVARLGDIDVKLASGGIVDLNSSKSAAKLAPYLSEIPDGTERKFVADRILSAARKSGFANVGALARLRISREELARAEGLDRLKQRLDAARPLNTVALLTPTEIRNLKPFLAVRTLGQFRSGVILWTGLFFLSFFGLHAYWRYRRFAGDTIMLPAIELLCGIGLMLMISLRDPVRDTLMFREFAEGVVAGLIAMAALSLPNYDLHLRRYSYVFILLTAVLGLLLRSPLGTGPGQSEAKVNLFFFQPVEVMRILIVLFLAGYFAENWDALRDLRSRQGWLGQRLHVPRLDYVIPVALGVAVAIALFSIVRDNGPALVVGALFLIMYAIARKRALAATVGFGVLVGVFWVAHLLRWPPTVAHRIDMWWAPWRNSAPGGDQLAHSIWSLATGAIAGTGPGLGNPAILPAGHTDLILSAAGEELGFLGLLAIFALYAILVWRGLKTALDAPGAYSFFLVAGLTLIIALQLILISGGLLGLIPLSGVVSPFLSFGRTSMVSNFAAFAMILSVSARAKPGAQQRPFGTPTYALAALLGFCGAAILARAAYFQVFNADEFLIKDAEVRYADKRLGLEYNPRLREVLAQVSKGDVLDRTGLPLATSNWDTLEKHRAEYGKLGVALDRTTNKSEPRHYPLGPEFFYLVGDTRTNLRRGATNTAFQEHQSRTRLQGFEDRREIVDLPENGSDEVSRVYQYDYSDVIALLRHRYEPDHPDVRSFLDRQRDVRMAIDARLQLRASEILKSHLQASGLKGAIVVLEPASGDLLAAVSYPWPEQWQFESFRANPDRSMELDFQDRARFGYYPPGSSFKIVTAIAALRANPEAYRETFECKPVGGGRVGNFVGASRRPIRDDAQDRNPHGTVDMAKGVIVSCNAYFAQLGFHIGAQPLFDTAKLFGILVAEPNTPQRLRQFLPQASYGQGEVRVTPLQMARVAAAIANAGRLPPRRSTIDDSAPTEPITILNSDSAAKIAGYMRDVVASPAGTGKALRGSPIAIAGKTGTAEVARAASHAWFIGFAPYGAGGKKIAFAVLVEHGRYGGRAAAPIAGEVVQAAREAGLL